MAPGCVDYPLARDFKPGGTVHNQIKDLVAARSLTSSLGIELPLLTRIYELFTDLRSHGSGDLDHSALFLEIERLAGISKGELPPTANPV